MTNILQEMNQLNEPSFQAQLMQNPRQALQKLGVEIPSTTEIKVLRNTKNSINLVVPMKGSMNDNYSFSDNQLANIAAGEIYIAAIAITATVVGIAGLAAAAVVFPLQGDDRL